MSKMNYRRGMRGAKRGKTPARFIPNGFVFRAKKIHRRAVRREAKFVIAIAMAEEEYYTPELKARDVVRLSRKPAQHIALWMYI